VIPLVVIGGGLAGAMAAIQVARAGRPVVLYERETGPHDKVCGEFLSFEAVDALTDAGLDLPGLGAVPITRLCVTVGRRRVTSALPFRALSLSRRILDEALLAQAAASGVDLRRGDRVTTIAACDGVWRIRMACGQIETARNVFLASGKHDLRGSARPAPSQGDMIGFKVHLHVPPDTFADHTQTVAVHLFRGGYAGVEPVEGGRLNLCLVVERSTFADQGRTWLLLIRHLAEVCAHLTPILAAAQASRLKPLAISRVPYGHVQRHTAPGLWRLGDQAAVIPSFAGEGMAIALHSGRLAATRYLAGDEAGDFQARLARQVGLRVKGAHLISRALTTGWGQVTARLMLSLSPGAPGLLGRLTRLPPGVIDAASAERCPAVLDVRGTPTH